MLEIISGRAGTGKTWYALEKIKEELLSNPMGPAIILLLPEHMTYKLERQLANLLADAVPGKGFSRCYVYGFRRFAYQILQETGGGLEPGLTELGRHLLLKQILDRRAAAKELQAFQRAARQRGFVGELGDIINELKGYCLPPETLRQVSQQVQDDRLGKKLQDMALIYEDFNQAMAGKYNDGKDILQKLLVKLPESQLLQGAELWLDGFQFFNPLEKQLLSQLLELCSNMHVMLTLDHASLTEGRAVGQLHQEDLFYRSLATRNYLLQLAQAKQAGVTERFLRQTKRYLSPALKEMEAQWQVLRPQPLKQPQTAEAVRIVAAATPRLELEAMAADIVRLVREQAYHWHDIGVLVREQDSYGSLLEMVLQEYNIPFFSDQKRQCVHHPLAELLRSALQLCSSPLGWHYENIFRCLKTGFFQLSRDSLDLLENYVLEFGLRGQKRWCQEEKWDFTHRHSLEEAGEADEEQLLRSLQADQLRRQVAEPLLALQQGMKAARDNRGMAAAVYEFLSELQVPQQLEQWAKADEAGLKLAEAREHQQLWQNIMDLLDQLVEIGGEATGIKEFAATLGEGLDNLAVSLIPPGVDYVNVAAFDQNSLDNIRAVYIVGANAGVMPRHASENVILSDADRLRINAAQELQQDQLRSLSVIGQENSYQEGYLLYKGFTQAREYLWVSYPLSDESGSSKEKARLVGWLSGLLPQAAFCEILQQEAGQAVEPRQALTALGTALRQCKETGQLSQEWQAVYNWAMEQLQLAETAEQPEAAEQGYSRVLKLLRQAIFSPLGADRLPQPLARQLFAGKGILRGSVTKLERYNSCPFQFYAQYGLKLQERKISRFSNPELGTLLHGVLKEFGQQLQREQRHWRDVSPEEQQAMCHEILHRLAPRLQNSILTSRKQLAAQLQRIENTANFALQRLCAFDAVSQLEPTLFEEGFGFLADQGVGQNEQALELVYQLSNHSRLSLNGQIDRIDATEDGSYFMIMDYKTGNASINIMDVYYGIKLQLLTYVLVAGQLLARKQGKKTLPIAMLYYFLKRPLVSVASHRESQQDLIKALEDKLKMPGWIVADKGLVELLDNTLQPGGKSRFINVGLKKDGELGASALHLRTERELELLLAYVEQLLQRTGERIMAGEIKAQPYRDAKGKTPCTYCQYHALCGFDAQLEGFGYQHVQQQKDIEFMENIEAELTPEMVQKIDARLSNRLGERQAGQDQIEEVEH